MTREEARELFSDYYEDALGSETRTRLLAYLETDSAAKAELEAYVRTLALLHSLPSREPALDLWREFAPHMAEYQSEMKLSLPLRLRRRWHEFVSEWSAGVILWTHVVASRAHARLEHHLLRDPLLPPR